MRPATIASLEVDGLKPARLLVVALLRFVLIVSALVAPAAGRVALDSEKTHFDTNHLTTIQWSMDNTDLFEKDLEATLRRSLNVRGVI